MEQDSAGPPCGSPNDPDLPKQWYLDAVHARDAWSVSMGTNVLIGVIDTGVDINNPDLRGRVNPGYDAMVKHVNQQDVSGHGTQVATVMAAEVNNRFGTAGIAPGATILPVMAADSSGHIHAKGIVRGLYWLDVQRNGPMIVYIGSHGPAGDYWFNAVRHPLMYNFLGAWYGLVFMPAGDTSYNIPYPNISFRLNVITGLTQSASGLTLGSQANSGRAITFAAPATNIACTTLGGGSVTVTGEPGRVGTSYAAAICAGIAALVLGKDLSMDEAGLADILQHNCVDPGGNQNVHTTRSTSMYGYGMPRADWAVGASHPSN